MNKRRYPVWCVFVIVLLSANYNSYTQVKTGIEVLRERNFDLLEGKAVGTGGERLGGIWPPSLIPQLYSAFMVSLALIGKY